MSNVINCPHCGVKWDQDEYIAECINNPTNLICECGGEFSIEAKVLSVEWVIKKNGGIDNS